MLVILYPKHGSPNFLQNSKPCPLNLEPQDTNGDTQYMEENNGLPLVAPKIVPKLDPDFRPAILANREFRRRTKDSGRAVPVEIALEQDKDSVSRFRTDVFPQDHEMSKGNFTYLERWLKFLLWSRGAGKIYFSGPSELASQLKSHYMDSPTGQFDAKIMGEKIYEIPFEIVEKELNELPTESESSASLGRHLNGCRIGFDLGASDRKVASVVDGKVVFSEEIKWNPVEQSDPQWHFNEIMDSLKRAAENLPEVEAIGGSSAGVYVKNHVKVASLFRGVPEDMFQTIAKPLFMKIKEAWNGIPLEIVNDGEVTALAGAMAIDDNGVLGVAMGSSEAAGYVNPSGNITTWLNELAFVPVDYNPQAAIDEWSGDYGCGVQYFSQQCVGRLLDSAEIYVDSSLGLPEKLEYVQELMEKGDERAIPIYKTVGTYFGYAIAHYSDFYDFKHLLILGRVTTGKGGQLIIDGAKHVLAEEFPELQEKIAFHIPDEKEKRHGQAIAAASLPVI